MSMKKIVILLFMALSLWADDAADAAKTLGYLNSYSQGLNQANKEHKLMMLVLVRDGCHWCKKFERETLSDAKIKVKLNDFVKVIVDQSDDFPEYFQSNFSPTVYFVNPKTQKSVWDFPGFKDPKEFTEDINAAKLEFKHLKK